MPDVVAIDPGRDTSFHLALRSTRLIDLAYIRLRMDLSGITGLGRVTITSGECGGGADVSIWCDTLMSFPNVPAQGTIATFRIVGSPNPPTVGKTVWAVMTGIVADVPVSRRIAFVFNAVRGSVDLAAIGATTASDGATNKSLKVGVKNVGTNPWFTQAQPPTIAHIVLPANVRVRSISQACHPDGTRKYRCHAEPLDPGATVWFDLKFDVDTDEPAGTGHITVASGADNHPANDKATIKVGSGAALPVTGPPTLLIGATGSGLVVLGAILLWITRRHRRQNPASTQFTNHTHSEL